jgi:predicted nucleic acid-binding protein
MIFVDSSAWLALVDIRDGNHRAGLAFHEELVDGKAGRLLTSDYILDETLTLMRKRSGLETVREFERPLRVSPSLQQIWVTPTHYEAALELFLGQGKKSWSFTDCTSFAIMRELGVREAFTFDVDFRQAGFVVRP